MINLQFPKLNSALIKNQKDMSSNDPRRGVIVVENHAIVLNAQFCLVVDLYDYFTIDFGITDPDDMKELKKVLAYMNGKTFQDEYWKELIKGVNVEVHENKGENGEVLESTLYIETPKYSKDLHYKDLEIALYEPLVRLIDVSELKEEFTSAIALPIDAISTIYTSLKNEVKGDFIIFEFNTPDKPVKFTFRDKKYMFGFLMPNYNSLEESFRFEYLNNFAKNKVVNYLVEEHKPAPVPLPEDEDGIPEVPEIPNLEEEIMKNRPSLFDSNGE